MKFIAPLSCIFLLLSACTGPETNDLAENCLHGPVKVFYDTYEFLDPEAIAFGAKPIESTFFYDVTGNLEKAEKKNLWKEGKAVTNFFATYTKGSNRKKSYKALDADGQLVEEGTYTWNSRTSYVLDMKGKRYRTTRIEYTLDELGRIKEKKSKSMDRGEMEKADHAIFYFNEAGDMFRSTSTNEIKKTSHTMLFSAATFDQFKNITLMYLIDEKTKDTVAKSTRRFEYYSK